jgi:hypothetical protein
MVSGMGHPSMGQGGMGHPSMGQGGMGHPSMGQGGMGPHGSSQRNPSVPQQIQLPRSRDEMVEFFKQYKARFGEIPMDLI